MIAKINPYNGISFSNRVPSISHAHCRTISGTTITAARIFNYIYRCGIRHIGVSNYYPSCPAYPLDNPQDTSVSLVGTDTLELDTIPVDAIGYPNAEHHDMDVRSLHINGIGSTFASGNPKGVSPSGVQDTWKYCFSKIFENLLFEDGGGCTINHPDWTDYYGGSLKLQMVKKMLDYDTERVLGIEYYNRTCETDVSDSGYSLELWDSILKSGRRCWGFCVPDHDTENFSITDTSTPPRKPFMGRNILLCDANEHDCLKAYRNGNFYGQIFGSELKFTSISYDSTSNILSVTTENADKIFIVIDGVYHEVSGNTVSYVIPDGSMYVRVEAKGNEVFVVKDKDGNDANYYDRIFSNPIIFGEREKGKKGNDDIVMLIG